MTNDESFRCWTHVTSLIETKPTCAMRTLGRSVSWGVLEPEWPRLMLLPPGPEADAVLRLGVRGGIEERCTPDPRGRWAATDVLSAGEATATSPKSRALGPAAGTGSRLRRDLGATGDGMALVAGAGVQGCDAGAALRADRE